MFQIFFPFSPSEWISPHFGVAWPRATARCFICMLQFYWLKPAGKGCWLIVSLFRKHWEYYELVNQEAAACLQSSFTGDGLWLWKVEGEMVSATVRFLPQIFSLKANKNKKNANSAHIPQEWALFIPRHSYTCQKFADSFSLYCRTQEAV